MTMQTPSQALPQAAESRFAVRNRRRGIARAGLAGFLGIVTAAAWAGFAPAAVPLHWRYTTQKPGPGWDRPGFDASSWKPGAPGFGCRRGLPRFQQERVKTIWETPEIWIRAAFESPALPVRAILRFSHDEDVEIRINGVPVVREAGYITNYRSAVLRGNDLAAFHPGANVIAAHCRQTIGGQFLDVSLVLFTGAVPEIRESGDRPRPEYPRPDFQRSEWKCLNGPWEFQIDPGRTGLKSGFQFGKKLRRTIRVPFPPESRLSGIGRTEFMRHVWYHRAVRVPKPWKGRRVLLHFGAVDYEAAVWVNGILCGRHRGGYTPFTCDITDALYRGIADIVVLADDPMKDAAQPTGKQARTKKWGGCIYTRTTGIWQTVWMEPVAATHLERPRLFADIPGGRELIFPAYGGPAGDCALRVQVFWKTRPLFDRTFPAVSTRVCAVPLAAGGAPLHLWAPGRPALYDYTLTLTRRGRVLDRVRGYFGLRDVRLDGARILINGAPVFQRLVLDQGFYPDGIYTAPSDSALRQDIELALRFGFNGARLHQKVFDPRYLYWADRLGFMVWGEFPDWGLDKSSAAAMAEHLAEWTEAVLRDRNHPAIVGWCPFNESPESEDRAAIRRAWQVTKALDPTRPVIDTSGYTHVVTDVYDCHNYTQDPKELARDFAAFARGGQPWHNHAGDVPYSGQPFMVSEFGGTRWSRGAGGWGYGGTPRSEKEFLDRFRGLIRVLLHNPRMAGFCYTQLYDIEQEQNGLCTYHRVPKFAPERIRAILSEPAAIERAAP